MLTGHHVPCQPQPPGSSSLLILLFSFSDLSLFIHLLTFFSGQILRKSIGAIVSALASSDNSEERKQRERQKLWKSREIDSFFSFFSFFENQEIDLFGNDSRRGRTKVRNDMSGVRGA